MEVRWSPEAADDLEDICQRIERDNPEAARRVAQAVFDGCNRLKNFPRIGRESKRVSGSRELVMSALPYIVVYEVADHAVEISRIYHAAKDWP